MKRVMYAIAVSGVFGVPAFAQEGGMAYAEMTCAEFTAMDSADQLEAVEAMQMASEEMASDEMMAQDDMASDDSMMTEDSMAADDSMMAEDSMAAEESMMAEDTVAAVLKACEGNPGMMAMDAMMGASGN